MIKVVKSFSKAFSCITWHHLTPFIPLGKDNADSYRRISDRSGVSVYKKYPPTLSCRGYWPICISSPPPWCGGWVTYQVQSDPDLVTPDLVTPRFSDRINFPRYRKLTVFDPDLVATPI
eukprot:sb/3476267/